MFHVKRPAAEALLRYRELLRRYHGTLDLLSDRGLADVDRWIEEAEAYAALIERVAPEGRVVLDVGSGAGLPGVVLAVRLPERRVILTERKRKRASFLMLVAGQLRLDNVEVVQGEVAALRGVRADVVVAQAVAELATVVRLTRHLMADGAVLLSRKGPEWRRELDALRAEYGTGIAVVAEEALGHRGSLVALRLAGG